MFEEKYKKLNPEQRKAVDSIDGPVMVIAGPGTGKTTILTLRIAQILQKTDTPAHGILAITYTDAGVKAMRDKLSEVIGERAHDVYIHTFHSFASAMISEYTDHFIGLRDMRQMTDVEKESLLRTVISEPQFSKLRPIGRPDAYLPAISRAITDAKKEALTPDMVAKHASEEIKKLKSDKFNLSKQGKSKGWLRADVLEKLDKLERTILFSKVYGRYEELKNEERLRDYDDLIISLLVTLEKDELLLRLIQERFLYLLVDEHQDTNDSQNFIISLIAQFFETPNIFIVGDEKQAIYRFQGASVENFLLLRKRWPKMKVISLETNYRSHQRILDASFSMIEKNYEPGEHDDLRVKLKSGGKVKPKLLDVISAEKTEAMEDYLCRAVGEISKKEPNATVAIITRRNRELEKVLAIFESKGIPVSSERSVDIFHHPLGAAFFDLLQYLVEPSRLDLLANTFVSGMWGLSFGQAVEFIREMRAGKVSDIEKKLPALSKINQRIFRN